MFRLLKIYILFNVHFILIKCIFPTQNPDDLTVRILDKKMIERKRQDTREMCRIFNSEASRANLPEEILSFNKYNSRKAELKLIQKKEEYKKKKTRRVKRDVTSNINPALNGEDEERIETIVDKIYDDLLERGQKIPYRRRGMPKRKNFEAKKSGRRFPFAPLVIEGPLPVKPPMNYTERTASKPVRFVHAIVPYFIDAKTYDAELVNVISNAFDYFEKATCIRLQRLRERPTDQQSLQNVVWLYITNPSGIRQCVHSNERAEIKGVQMIVFGYDCMSLGDITHEIMHVLGFPHEHVRPDRDQYITVLWDNIKPGYRKYFEVHNNPIVESLPYDYGSVLHYPPRAFSKNGQVTIMTEPGIKIGQREGLSEMDIEKVGMLYSNECIKRNRDYLKQTCPSVVKADTTLKEVSPEDIEEYFSDRIWPYGVVHYKLKNKMEFTSDERENIMAVIGHIQKQTCIEFQELTNELPTADDDKDSEVDQFESDQVERLVVLTGSRENRTRAILPDTSSSSNEQQQHKKLNAEIEDPVETLKRNGEKEKGTNSVKGAVKKIAKTNVKEKKANVVVKEKTNIGTREKNAKMVAKEKTNIGAKERTNIGAKEKTNTGTREKNAKIVAKEKTNIGAKENTNISAKEKNASVIKQQSVLRRKRAVPPTPSRRHANDIVVLSRSSQPGCHCPQPGKPDGTYELKINTDCFNSVNDLMHLFVHVLGLDHQHNMHDRDSYLHIVWDQLSEEMKQEMKVKLPPAASVGFTYDYQSVMHYPWLQIKNGKTNIMYPIWNDGWEMGHWQGLSSTDVQKLSFLYSKRCKERAEQAETTIEPTSEPEEDPEPEPTEPITTTRKRIRDYHYNGPG